MAGKANGTAGGQSVDAGAAKKRSQLIVIAVGGVLLVALVGFQLPGLFGSSSPSGTAAAATTPPPAVPVVKPAAVGALSSPVPRWIRLIGERDVFVPQVVVVAAAGPSSAAAPATPTPPPVRATGWVVKDPFVPQVALPTAATPTVTTPAPITRHVAPTPSPQSGGYIVVLQVIAGGGSASEAAAAHDVVAAKNAGLRDVAANDAVPGTTRMGTHFTVYTGPYPSAATAQPELVRALRNGYPTAHTQHLPASPGKGF
jgi:hypothetical protein